MKDQLLIPNYIFDAGWEVCNNTEGIHHTIKSKAHALTARFGNNYLTIGPDVWKETHENPQFAEDTSLFRSWREEAAKSGLHFRIGRWQVPGEPVAVLVDFTPLFGKKDKILTDFWLKYGLDSLSGQWDYTEPALFGYAAAQVIKSFYDFHLSARDKMVAHFHQWNSGTGVLFLKEEVPQAGTLFTCHESVIKQAMASISKDLPLEMEDIEVELLASELGVSAKFSLEKTAARLADCFTLTEEASAGEAFCLLGMNSCLITPESEDGAESSLEKAYHTALEASEKRFDLYKDKKSPSHALPLPTVDSMRPKWKKVTIGVNVPGALKSLTELARNIWWTWNYDARELFEQIDPRLWERCGNNPIVLVNRLTMEHYERLTSDAGFMDKYQAVERRFHDYMEKGRKKKSQPIAYFSMEYGLHETIKIYSGGLGVLAGDYLKQASDDNIDMVGVGLLYRYGYFTQNLSADGEQADTYHRHDFDSMAAQAVRDEHGKRVKISIAFPGRTLHARVYKIDVGRVPLYLLDTDISDNVAVDRFITHQLYGGDWENRFKQEFLLGIGGIRLLDALGLKPAVFHCNEGHAAFAGLERLREYVQEDGLRFGEALEVVRNSSLFTTHTPVPAGHDFFSEDMLRTYMPHYADRLAIEWQEFMALGKMNPQDMDERYSMSVLAANLSQQVNGVSLIHGKVSREMFKDLYHGYFAEELHIGHVTNGVHYGTWTAREWQDLYSRTFGEDFLEDVSNASVWEKIRQVDDAEIWKLRNLMRKNLLEYIGHRLLSNLPRRRETPRKIYQMMDSVGENTLTIGFARRFATYKRAHLLFNDLERLSRIVNHPKMPVQIIYAGKAHPADKAGQELIRQILEISRRDEFRGKIIFLEDYDMELGRELVKGVDIWLNTPTRPQEASGTSGQKAVLNGVMNLSVLDGWWAEGYRENAGWKLKEEKTFDNQDFQNELDAETIYGILENEVVPMFYERNSHGIPTNWIAWIKNCISEIAPHYTNKRMMDDYFEKFYNKLFDSSEQIQANGFEAAKKMFSWKSKVVSGWDSVRIEETKLMSTSGQPLLLGEPFVAELLLDPNGLDPDDFGVEVVFVQKSLDGKREIASVYEMQKAKTFERRIRFSCEVPAKRTGSFNYAFRLFPKHPDLAHRQDFHLVKWL